MHNLGRKFRNAEIKGNSSCLNRPCSKQDSKKLIARVVSMIYGSYDLLRVLDNGDAFEIAIHCPEFNIWLFSVPVTIFFVSGKLVRKL